MHFKPEMLNIFFLFGLDAPSLLCYSFKPSQSGGRTNECTWGKLPEAWPICGLSRIGTHSAKGSHA